MTETATVISITELPSVDTRCKPSIEHPTNLPLEIRSEPPSCRHLPRTKRSSQSTSLAIVKYGLSRTHNEKYCYWAGYMVYDTDSVNMTSTLDYSNGYSCGYGYGFPNDHWASV